MTKTAAALNELIEETRDGLQFYSDAIAHVGDPHLKTVFRAIVDAKNRLIAALSEQVQLRGAAPSAGQTLGGNLRRNYAEILVRLGHGGDAACVARLEAEEERLLAAFESAAAAAGDEPLRHAIAEHLPRLHLCHEEMRNLRNRLAA